VGERISEATPAADQAWDVNTGLYGNYPSGREAAFAAHDATNAAPENQPKGNSMQSPNEDKNEERCWLRDRIAAAIVHTVSADYPTWTESLALADVVIQELGLVRDPFGAPDPFGTFTFHRYVTKWVLTPGPASGPLDLEQRQAYNSS